MKKFLIGISILMSACWAQAEDSVFCSEDITQLDVALTDSGRLNVQLNKNFWLVRAEVYYSDNSYQQLTKGHKLAKNKDVSKIILTIDNGTSVRNIYHLDMKNFEDGSEFPIETFDLYPGVPTGRTMPTGQISCEAAQS